MPNLVYSQKFGRTIRLDPPEELGVPTQTLIERALADADAPRALSLLAYMHQEREIVDKTVLGGWLAKLVTYLLERLELEDLRLVTRIPGEATRKGFEVLARDRFTAAYETIERGAADEARPAFDGMRKTYNALNDLVVCWVQDIPTVLATAYGEDEPATAMRSAYEEIRRERYRLWVQLTAGEQLALSAECMRAHFGGPTRRGEFVIGDEGDCYATFFDPCGTGGILCRGDPETRAGPYATEGFNSRPKDWTWGATGVPRYNTHCNLYLETFAAEDHGYPIRPVGHDPDPHAPCVWYIYKDPGRTRAEHFVAIDLQPSIGSASSGTSS